MTVATFTDANPSATIGDFTATITWGDGTTSTGTITEDKNGVFSVTGTHTYAEKGSDPIGVTIKDVDGNVVSTTSTATVADDHAPRGFIFTPDTATLAALLGNGEHLVSGEPIGTFTETGGAIPATFTHLPSAASAQTLSDSAGTNSELLSTAAVLNGNGAGTVYALTVEVFDTTNSTHSDVLPFDIVVANSSAGTTNLETGLGNLGISATTQTIVYGSKGSDNINATGMTANVWFVGGPGSDTMTGGSGHNTYLYDATSDSTTSTHDTITNFDAARDTIDLSAITGATTIQGVITGSTSIAANSIAWIESGGNTIVYVNNTNSAESQSSASMEIVLTGIGLGLTSKDFIPDPPATASAVKVPNATAAANTTASSAETQGANLVNDQNGFSTSTWLTSEKHGADPAVTGNSQAITWAATLSAFGAAVVVDMLAPDSNHIIVPTVKLAALGGDQVIVAPVIASGLGAVHAIVPPVTAAAGNTLSFLSAVSPDGDQGLSLGGDQNGLLTKTSSLENDHVTAPPAITAGLAGDQIIAAPVNTSGLNEHVIALPIKTAGLNDLAIAPPAVTSVHGDDQIIAPPVNASGLNEHTIAPPVDTSVHGANIILPVTDGAGSAAGFLSDANPNSAQGLSLGSDQNGLLTKTFLLGNDHVIAPPAVTSGFNDHAIAPPVNASGLNEHAIAPPVNTSGLNDHVIPPVNTSGLGADHAIVPPVTDAAGNASSFLSAASTDSDQGLSLDSDQNGSLTKTSSQWNDHAAGPANETAFGSDQVSAATATSHDGDAAPPANELALGGDTVTAPPPATSALGGSDLAAFGRDQAAVPMAGPTPGSVHSGAITLTTAALPIAVVAPGTPVLDSEHLTDSTIVDGSGVANSEVTPTAPANEHAVAPTLATSPTPATSPTLASASLGAWGNDSFAFLPNLGSDTAQSMDAHTSEIAHNNVQIGGPALVSIAPEFHQEFAFDAIHQDAANLAATVDQFHQMAANSTLLH